MNHLNRPLRYFAIGTVLMVPLVLVYSCKKVMAQSVPSPLSPAMTQAFNNFSHEMQTCQIYNLVAYQCFKDQDPQLGATVEKTAAAFGELAANSAKIVGLSNKAVLARTNIIVEEMKADLDGNCVNISVLLNKYAKKCKAAMETSSETVESILKGKK